MKSTGQFDIIAAFDDGAEIDRAIHESVRDALCMHKRLGNPVATMENGRVVWIPPERITDDGTIAPPPPNGRAKTPRRRVKSRVRSRRASPRR